MGMARELRHEIGKKFPFAEPAEEAFLNLIRTTAALSSEQGKFFRPYGLTEARYNALRILRGHGAGGVTCQTIHDEMVVPSPDVTRLVDGLEAAGWATRERSAEDRRSVLVRITERGLELLRTLDEPILEHHRTHLGHMTKDELATLSRLLVKARQAVSPAAAD